MQRLGKLLQMMSYPIGIVPAFPPASAGLIPGSSAGGLSTLPDFNVRGVILETQSLAKYGLKIFHDDMLCIFMLLGTIAAILPSPGPLVCFNMNLMDCNSSLPNIL
uniref:Uncharacterized protein n=1 Tax=Glossina pallidipes TaxID=7398 RepID=A0A1A9ZM76_GLOPL